MIFTFVVLYFQGLGLLKRVSSLKEEAHQLEEKAQHLQMEGLEKVEVAVAGSEVEGFYKLLRGAIAHHPISSAPPPPKKAHHTPSTTVSHLPPQESTGPKVSGPTVDIPEQASEVASPATLPASEQTLPAGMQPLCIQLGGIKQVYQCWVEGYKEGPSTSHATICAHVCKVHLGVGLVCPSWSKSFFNPDTFWHHNKSHVNL